MQQDGPLRCRTPQTQIQWGFSRSRLALCLQPERAFASGLGVEGGWVNASILNCVVRIEATQSLVCFPGHRYRHLGEKGRRVPRPQTSVQTSGRSECRAPGTGVASALAPADRGFSLKSPGTGSLAITSLPTPSTCVGSEAQLESGVPLPLACHVTAAPAPSSEP